MALSHMKVRGGGLGPINCGPRDPITLLSPWVVFMGLAIDSRIKPLDVMILMFQTEYEVKTTKHISSSK